MKNICLRILVNYNFSTVCIGQGAINKDPTVWLDGARPANTGLVYPTLLPREHTAQMHSIPTKRYISE